jgi:hypothetical protein
MSFYPYALLLHILGMLALFIAIGIELTALLRLRSANTTYTVREWLRILDPLEKAHPVISLVILVSGLIMTLTSWGWSQGWIVVPALLIPRMKALHRAMDVAPEGALPETVKQLIDAPTLPRPQFAAAFTALGIVYLMTTKPGWIVSIGVILVSPLIGLLLSRLRPNRQAVVSPSIEKPAAHY